MKLSIITYVFLPYAFLFLVKYLFMTVFVVVLVVWYARKCTNCIKLRCTVWKHFFVKLLYTDTSISRYRTFPASHKSPCVHSQSLSLHVFPEVTTFLIINISFASFWTSFKSMCYFVPSFFYLKYVIPFMCL